jgi:arsenate reductase
MAEGLLRHLAGDRFEVFSAGTKPSHVRPEAIAAMREIGIDISQYRSKSLDEFTGHEFDYVITVCDSARDACPAFPGAKHQLHWPFRDPSAVEGTDQERMGVFREVRDRIAARLKEFVTIDDQLR